MATHASLPKRAESLIPHVYGREPQPSCFIFKAGIPAALLFLAGLVADNNPASAKKIASRIFQAILNRGEFVDEGRVPVIDSNQQPLLFCPLMGAVGGRASVSEKPSWPKRPEM